MLYGVHGHVMSVDKFSTCNVTPVSSAVYLTYILHRYAHVRLTRNICHPSCRCLVYLQTQTSQELNYNSPIRKLRSLFSKLSVTARRG